MGQLRSIGSPRLARATEAIYLDAEVYRRLKALARAPGVPRSVGAGSSGIPDLGSRVHELLADGVGEA